MEENTGTNEQLTPQASSDQVASVIALAELLTHEVIYTSTYEVTLVGKLGNLLLSAHEAPKTVGVKLNVALSDHNDAHVLNIRFDADGAYVPLADIDLPSEQTQAEQEAMDMRILRHAQAAGIVESVADYWMDRELLQEREIEALRWLKDEIAILERSVANGGLNRDDDLVFASDPTTPCDTLYDFTVSTFEYREDVKDLAFELPDGTYTHIQFAKAMEKRDDDEIVYIGNNPSIFIQIDDPDRNASSALHMYANGAHFAMQMPLYDYTMMEDYSEALLSASREETMPPYCELAAVSHISSVLSRIKMP